MRKELIQAMSLKEAFIKCPWAAVCVPVIEGVLYFESIDDFKIWKNQK